MDRSNLPVYALLPEIKEQVRAHGGCILRAAPGAGKTMLVPAALTGICSGKILLMEPSRIAAKGAAYGVAALNGWCVGREVGFSVRGESILHRENRIVVATPGVVLNMLQNDPELTGFDVVVFDEFHERGFEQELIFALLGESRAALREDLAIVVMSATLDDEIKTLLPELPEINVPGREYPVDVIYRESSNDLFALPGECAGQVLRAYRDFPGDILVFLPGKNEIDRCFEALDGVLENCEVMKLHGALSLSEQSRVLAKLPDDRRKVVLATNIAESSLTIDGITVVIDSGWERRMHFAPGMGMPSLDAGRISLASAQQRAGRAGRTAPGKAVRMWSRRDEMSFRPHSVPEILECDLARVVLEIVRWGSDFRTLPWLTPPPEANFTAAAGILRELGLLDARGGLTAAGRRAAGLPVHPRLAAMLIFAGEKGLLPLAVEIASLLEESVSSKLFAGGDLRELVRFFRHHKKQFLLAGKSCQRLLEIFNVTYEEQDVEYCGILVAHAYPEWIGRNKNRHGILFQLTGGRTARLKEDDLLRKEEFLAVADLSVVSGRDAAVRLAAPLDKCEIEDGFCTGLTEEDMLTFVPEDGKVSASRIRRLGAMILDSRPVAVDPAVAGKIILKEALRRKMLLPPEDNKAAVRFLERVRFARRNGDDTMPDWGADNLEKVFPELAAGFTGNVKDFISLGKLPWLEILKSGLDYSSIEDLNRLYPDKFITPAGAELPIDYSGEQPTLSVPLQQMYGVTVHPVVGKKRLPLRVELLSPARRPVQITCDLPGFWRGSWNLVRTEMRSRYPKHDWPENPAQELARRSSVKKR